MAEVVPTYHDAENEAISDEDGSNALKTLINKVRKVQDDTRKLKAEV